MMMNGPFIRFETINTNEHGFSPWFYDNVTTNETFVPHSQYSDFILRHCWNKCGMTDLTMDMIQRKEFIRLIPVKLRQLISVLLSLRGNPFISFLRNGLNNSMQYSVTNVMDLNRNRFLLS